MFSYSFTRSFRTQAFLKLHKQRFLCKSCNHTFTTSSPIVDKHCFISHNTRLAISLDAKKKVSEKDIASFNHVSHSTVHRLLRSLHSHFKFRKDFLPPHLCFDEFKSVKSSHSHMSFLFLDASNGSIIDILQNRQLAYLTRYFYRFSLQARQMVKTICVDMYTPYITLIHQLFPNAKIITDRFHTIQLLSRSLNKTRILLMKQHKQHYHKLKRYWKLLLKYRYDLNMTDFKPRICFKKWMREVDIVDYLLHLDDSFKESYLLYQQLLTAIKERDIHAFNYAIDHANDTISDYMKTSIRTLKEYRPYILNSLEFPYSNGPIEGVNNLIKVIKRIAFGYRSFSNFKTRILLISNTMVKCT
ncbi:MAG: ISL3 family transposase [Erysipelotrichaceae bacterium]|nr:ISL3 family transposase [Erysipelotrichaceae bacterium]